MTQAIDAIYEGGMLRPLTSLHLQEHERVRIVVETAPENAMTADPPMVDPLAGLARDLGAAELAENFDDYRFGRRQL